MDEKRFNTGLLEVNLALGALSMLFLDKFSPEELWYKFMTFVLYFSAVSGSAHIIRVMLFGSKPPSAMDGKSLLDNVVNGAFAVAWFLFYVGLVLGFHEIAS